MFSPIFVQYHINIEDVMKMPRNFLNRMMSCFHFCDGDGDSVGGNIKL